MTLRARRTEESGATLVELLMFISITGIVMATIASAFAVVTRNTQSAEDRLEKSHDAQLVANYVVRDAQNSGGPSEVSTTDVTTCWDAADPRVPDPVLRLNWTSTGIGGGTTAMTVNYLLVDNPVGADGATSSTLLRRECAAGVLVSETPVAHNVASASATCAPGSCAANPTKVALTVRETADAADATGYQYSLAATFRKDVGATPPSVPGGGIHPPLFLLSKTGTGLALGNGNVNVVGGGMIFINSSLTVGPNGDINGDAGYAGTCSSHQNNDVCPSYEDTNVAAEDPYKGLSALPDPTTGLATYSDGKYHGPGIYTNELQISGSGTTNLAAGIYILRDGMSLSGSATITSDSDGVLLFVDGGSLDFAGSAKATLLPMTNGTYEGFSIFQPSDNSSAMGLSGGGSAYGGVIYAPSAAVSINGGGSVSSGAVIANTADFSGNNATVTVGS